MVITIITITTTTIIIIIITTTTTIIIIIINIYNVFACCIITATLDPWLNGISWIWNLRINKWCE